MNITLQEFGKFFNNDFWRAFKSRAFPITIPKTKPERDQLVNEVYLSIKSGRYAPSIPEAEVVINKGFGIARTVPIFTIKDYCVYYFCVKSLEEMLCKNITPNTFGGWTLGGKIRRAEDNEIESESTIYGRYSFSPKAWTHAFGEFNSLLFAQLDSKRYKYVLQFDLANFYDSIRLDMLERWMREEADASKGWIISLLFYFLNQWNRKNTGLHPQAVGLPQDALADCSRILANYYLRKYDKFACDVCGNYKAEYFRYADDQMVLFNKRSSINGFMLLLTRSLDRYNLRVNQKKTKFWIARQLQEYRCRNIQSIFSKIGDNKNCNKVKEFVVKVKQISIQDTWNEGMPLLNRLLFANLICLPQKHYEWITKKFLSKQYLLSSTWDKIKRIDELNEKREKPKNLPRLLMRLAKVSVHNSFHYEVREYAAFAGKRELLKFINQRILDIENQMQTKFVK